MELKEINKIQQVTYDKDCRELLQKFIDSKQEYKGIIVCALFKDNTGYVQSSEFSDFEKCYLNTLLNSNILNIVNPVPCEEKI